MPKDLAYISQEQSRRETALAICEELGLDTQVTVGQATDQFLSQRGWGPRKGRQNMHEGYHFWLMQLMARL